MATKKFSKVDLVGLIFGNETSLTLVEEGKWQDEGKYSYKDFIFLDGGKYYLMTADRSGSYFTDYNYGCEYWDDMVQCHEVVKIEEITHKWVPLQK